MGPNNVARNRWWSASWRYCSCGGGGWRSAKQWCFYHQKWRGLLSRRVKTANIEYIGHLWTIGKRKIANIDIGRHFGLRFRMIQRDYIQRWLKIQHTTLKLRSVSKSRGAFPRLCFYFSLSLAGFGGQFYTSSTTPPYLWRHCRDPTSAPRSFNCGKKCSSSVALDRCYRCESFWSRIGIGPNNLTKRDTKLNLMGTQRYIYIYICIWRWWYSIYSIYILIYI